MTQEDLEIVETAIESACDDDPQVRRAWTQVKASAELGIALSEKMLPNVRTSISYKPCRVCGGTARKYEGCGTDKCQGVLDSYGGEIG